MVIQSPDTNVFVLSIWSFLICLLKQNLLLAIPLKPLYKQLGERNAAAVPGCPAFTGADQTGRFAGKSKLKCWKTFKTFQAASDDIKEAFIELGKAELPSMETEARLKQFVCQLYDPNTSLHELTEL